jgi:hypothetical protein
MFIFEVGTVWITETLALQNTSTSTSKIQVSISSYYSTELVDVAAAWAVWAVFRISDGYSEVLRDSQSLQTNAEIVPRLDHFRFLQILSY